MKKNFFLNFFAFLHCAVAQSDSYESCGRNAILDHIKFETIAAGTTETQAGDFPWVVSYGFYDSNKNWQHRCGGTIINSRMVVTAFHCFRDLDSSNPNGKFKVMAGGVDFKIQEDEVSKVQIRDIMCGFKHPQKFAHLSSLYFDVAILYMDKPFVFSKYVRPMCIVKYDSHQYYGRLSRIVGWGSGTLPLREASVQIFSENFCNKTYEKSGELDRTAGAKAANALPNLFNNTVLCAGDDRSSTGACQGDSGGPLLIFQEGDGLEPHYEQVGIISGQIRCTKFPDVYTNLGEKSIRNFIINTMANAEENEVKASRDGLCIVSGDSLVYRYLDGKYRGDVVNGDRHGYGTMSYEDGTVYKGQWKNDLKFGNGWANYSVGYYVGQFDNNAVNGRGTFYYNDGSVYEGQWKDDYWHGHGKFQNGSYWTYEGQYVHGQGDGYGVFNSSDEIYYGSWKTDKRNGFGNISFSNGNSYEGQFIDDAYNGNGTFYWANGDIYEGNWINSNKNGWGKMTYADGSTYEGNWKNNLFDGYGRQTYPNGNSFEGLFSVNFRYGNGTFKWANGDLYEGFWILNLKHGYGKLRYANGNSYEGNFGFDKRNGNGTFYWKNGDTYEGQWQNDGKNGFGKLTYNDGSVYTGYWQKDKYNGEGTYIYNSKSNIKKDVGTFSNGLLNGEGTRFWKNGQTYQGSFLNGELNE